MVKMLVKKIRIPIFNQNVNLICGGFQESVEYLSALHGKQVVLCENIDGVCYTIDDQVYVILDPSYITLPTLIHELGHATFEVMNNVGLEIDDQEAFCYLQSYIFEQLACTLSIPTDPINLPLEQEDMEQS